MHGNGDIGRQAPVYSMIGLRVLAAAAKLAIRIIKETSLIDLGPFDLIEPGRIIKDG